MMIDIVAKMGRININIIVNAYSVVNAIYRYQIKVFFSRSYGCSIKNRDQVAIKFGCSIAINIVTNHIIIGIRNAGIYEYGIVLY